MRQVILLLVLVLQIAHAARVQSHSLQRSRVGDQVQPTLPPRRKNPFGAGNNPFGGGRPKLNPVKPKQPKDRVQHPPETIEDTEFVNLDSGRGPLTKVSDAFDKWGAKVLLVDFFAYSCTNCIRTIPHMRDIYRKYHKHGLEVVAFARPEFQFEGLASNVRNWIVRNNIQYPVALDNNGTNWKLWKVDSWPTHYLVLPDRRTGKEGKYFISYVHSGDRNGHLLENEIITQLNHLAGDGFSEQDVPPMDDKFFSDAEVFLGKSHRHKNSGSGGCNHETKACVVEDVESIDAWKEGLGAPEPGKYTVYGAAWCPWCRKAKILLHIAGIDFNFIDVDKFGGPASVRAALWSKESPVDHKPLLPVDHKTMPMVYGANAEFIGGFSDTLAKFPEVDMDEVNRLASTAVIQFNKYTHNVTVSVEDVRGWSLDAEAMISKASDMTTKDAALEIRAEMNPISEEESGAVKGGGVQLFAVCEPPKGEVGWIEVDSGGAHSIRFPGRHFLKSYPRLDFHDVIRVSKGMKVYVLWLSTEPYDPEHNVASL